MPNKSDSRNELPADLFFFAILATVLTGVAVWLLFFDRRSDVVPEALVYLLIACFALWAGFKPLLPEVEVTCQRKE